MLLRSTARLFTLFLCLFAVSPTLALAGDPFPHAASAYVVKTGGTTVWSHQADAKRSPASLTKIMTALLVLEKVKLDEIAVVSPEAAAETGSRIHLNAGEQLRVGDLLAALLVKSANDAAHALADHVSGSEDQFALLMNRKAAELGMTNTHFVNASGLDHPRQHSTAADLARLAEAALENPVFRTLVCQSEMEIRTVNGARSYRFRNSNKLLGAYDGLVGVKTGYTSKAGPCLIALAEREEGRVLVVLLNSPQRWKAAPKILDQAFEQQTHLAKSTAIAERSGPNGG